MEGMIWAAMIGAAVGIAASVAAAVVSYRRDAEIWDEVNKNREVINRIQTMDRWKKYGKEFGKYEVRPW